MMKKALGSANSNNVLKRCKPGYDDGYRSKWPIRCIKQVIPIVGYHIIFFGGASRFLKIFYSI